MSILELLDEKKPKATEAADNAEAETYRAITELVKQAQPLIEVKRQYVLATAEIKEQVDAVQNSLQGLQQQLTDLTVKLEGMEKNKAEINALETELLTKLLAHPELTR